MAEYKVPGSPIHRKKQQFESLIRLLFSTWKLSYFQQSWQQRDKGAILLQVAMQRFELFRLVYA